MGPQYIKFIERKSYEHEVAVNYAVKRLKDIIFQYDLPFISDEMKQLLKDLSRLKMYLEHDKNINYDTPND